jgi:uncharacterized membrane protein
MNRWKLLAYGVLALVALVVLQLVVSFMFGVLDFLLSIVTMAVTLLLIAGLLYGGYRILSWVRGSESASGSDPVETSTSDDRVERLKQQYADGKLSEDELKQRLDRELGGPSVDALDRELRRERE